MNPAASCYFPCSYPQPRTRQPAAGRPGSSRLVRPVPPHEASTLCSGRSAAAPQHRSPNTRWPRRRMRPAPTTDQARANCRPPCRRLSSTLPWVPVAWPARSGTYLQQHQPGHPEQAALRWQQPVSPGANAAGRQHDAPLSLVCAYPFRLGRYSCTCSSHLHIRTIDLEPSSIRLSYVPFPVPFSYYGHNYNIKAFPERSWQQKTARGDRKSPGAVARHCRPGRTGAGESGQRDA